MSPDDVTPDAMSTMMGATVGAVESERIGDGLVGLNLRVQLLDADPALPPSVMLKLPSLDATSRATGVMLRNYEREVKFYTEVADTVDIRVPHCHFGEWNESDGDFTLVLEDMAPAETGDQIRGCGLDTALAAIDELAKLHAPRWDDPTLVELDWIGRRTDEDAAAIVGLWTMFMPGFLDTYTAHLSADQLDLLERFGVRLADWLSNRDGPLAVTHGDYRLDNLMFGVEPNSPAVTAVDWQTPGHGPPVADLSYFCGAGLLPQERAANDRTLVERYGQALADGGVSVDSDWLWRQYRRHTFGGVVMAVVASQVVGESERSEKMFAAMATRHLQHALDLDSFDLI